MAEPRPVSPSVGLCARCTWMRPVTSSRGSVFYLCGLSELNDAFAKYPVLPVLACPGFQDVDSGSSHPTTC